MLLGMGTRLMPVVPTRPTLLRPGRPEDRIARWAPLDDVLTVLSVDSPADLPTKLVPAIP